MATHAIILAVAPEAPLAVRTRLEPVAPRPPEIIMVPGRTRVVAFDTVVPVVAREAARPLLTRLVDAERDRGAMVLKPVSPVGVGLREGNAAALRGILSHGLKRRCFPRRFSVPTGTHGY